MTVSRNLQSTISNLQSNEQVLSQVQAAVGQALDAVKQREREAEALILDGGNQETVLRLWTDGLRAYQEKLQHLQTVAEQAQASVADVDTNLAEGESGFRDWLAATARAREKLTVWLGQAVG
jgi:uncharacterized protein YukE